MGKKSVECSLNKPGFAIAIAEAATTGIKRYKLLIAKSDLPSANKSIKATIATKRQAYGTALVRADGNFTEDGCIVKSTCN